LIQTFSALNASLNAYAEIPYSQNKSLTMENAQRQKQRKERTLKNYNQSEKLRTS
jgi:hypothetical protein